MKHYQPNIITIAYKTAAIINQTHHGGLSWSLAIFILQSSIIKLKLRGFKVYYFYL